MAGQGGGNLAESSKFDENESVSTRISQFFSAEGWGVSDLALPGAGFGRAGGPSFGGVATAIRGQSLWLPTASNNFCLADVPVLVDLSRRLQMRC